ncbi:MAG TPA: LolA-related protein [Steroidobacteraceae bacterium]|nr:LolA-related protein [Steroidobacteraceae bacterium]
MSAARSRAPWRALLAACAAVLPMSTALPAPTDPAFAQLLQLLAARRDGQVAFTEVQHLAMLDHPLASSGELYYRAPDHLEKRTLEPKPETLLLDHGVLTARSGARTHVLSLRDYPQVLPFVESIRATLAGDAPALERYFRVDFSGSLEHWTLALKPADASVARIVQEIRIAGERDVIHSVQIRQTDGDESVMTLGPPIGP